MNGEQRQSWKRDDGAETERRARQRCVEIVNDLITGIRLNLDERGSPVWLVCRSKRALPRHMAALRDYLQREGGLDLGVFDVDVEGEGDLVDGEVRRAVVGEANGAARGVVGHGRRCAAQVTRRDARVSGEVVSSGLGLGHDARVSVWIPVLVAQVFQQGPPLMTRRAEAVVQMLPDGRVMTCGGVVGQMVVALPDGVLATDTCEGLEPRRIGVGRRLLFMQRPPSTKGR
jgi:hypothetical protein